MKISATFENGVLRPIDPKSLNKKGVMLDIADEDTEPAPQRATSPDWRTEIETALPLLAEAWALLESPCPETSDRLTEMARECWEAVEQSRPSR